MPLQVIITKSLDVDLGAQFAVKLLLVVSSLEVVAERISGSSAVHSDVDSENRVGNCNEQKAVKTRNNSKQVITDKITIVTSVNN